MCNFTQKYAILISPPGDSVIGRQHSTVKNRDRGQGTEMYKWSEEAEHEEAVLKEKEE